MKPPPQAEFPFEKTYPSIAAIPLTLFSVLVIAWWLEIGIRKPLFAQIRFEFLLTAIVVLMALMRVGRKKAPQHLRKSKVERLPGNKDVVVASAVLLVALVINLPFALDVGLAWNDYFNRILKLAVIGFLIPQFVVSPLTLRIYLLSLLIPFLKVGQEAFLGKINGSMVWENQGVPRLHGTTGTMFGGPNSLSGRMVSALAFTWYGFWSVRSRLAKYLLVMMAVFIANAVLFAGSRTGYLATIFTVLLIWNFAKGSAGKKLLILFSVLAVALVGVTFIPSVYKERFLSSFTGQEAEGRSSETRMGLLKDSLRVPLERPIGLGIGNFKVYQAALGRNAQDTHNLYTQLLAEGGIQSLIAFLAFLWVILRKAFRVRFAMAAVLPQLREVVARAPPAQQPLVNKELHDARLIFFTATALIVFLFGRLFLGIFGHDLLEMYWWMAAGMAMALHSISHVTAGRAAELVSAASAWNERPAR